MRNDLSADKRGHIGALSPLALFVVLYLVTSILAGDFYKVPISVAFAISGIFAVATTPRLSLGKRITLFGRGASTPNIMLMLWVFLLAGAFATSAKDIGSIDATVNLMLRILPDNMLLAGLFVATCFISLSIGTSVGTIVALVPIAAGLAEQTGTSVPLLTAVVVSGAFFGDNLSFISDTTIVATSTQGCKMSDKFRVNAFIVIPVALLIIVIYTWMGMDIETPSTLPPLEVAKVLPYIAVPVTAVCGVNVMVVLVIGILLTGLIGWFTDTCDMFGWFGSMGNGMAGMGELIIITMLAGGLFEMVRHNGGIDYIIRKTTAHIKGKRGAELVIGSLTALIDACTANNTVAIITVGGIARRISEQYGLDNRRVASILDTFSCCMQGLIPYGAQMLMAASLAKVNPVDILPYLYYPIVLATFTIAAILIRYPRRYS
ncbi:MAG: Na+/H+ antiporter NhaC family protein [Prevotella sp.]